MAQQRFQLTAGQQSAFKNISSLRQLETKSEDPPLTFPSLSGRASQDAATEVGFPFNGQTSKFSGALAGAGKQPYTEETSKSQHSIHLLLHSRDSYTATSKINVRSTHGSGPCLSLSHHSLSLPK